MLTAISLSLFGINANSMDGYGFHVFSVGYSVTKKMTSSKNIPMLSVNFRKQNYKELTYDITLWLCILGFGKKFYLKRNRPTREDKMPYWDWYNQAKKEAKELTGREYHESWSTKHYYENLTPSEAAEEYDSEF